MNTGSSGENLNLNHRAVAAVVKTTTVGEMFKGLMHKTCVWKQQLTMTRDLRNTKLDNFTQHRSLHTTWPATEPKHL